MTTWDDAAGWYLARLAAGGGFNDLATELAVDLLGDVGGRRVLDVGCGEGGLARRLARAGAAVTGLEPTAALLRAAEAAEEREPLGITYRPGRAEDLDGVAAGTMDAVCALLVLHHVEDLAAALAGARRVLVPGGALVVVLPHPWADHAGAGWSGTADAPRRVIGDYLDEGFWSAGRAEGRELESVSQIGWYHRTVATWLTAAAGAGFHLQEAREPAGGPGRGAGPWSRVPRFLAFRARAA